jgi:hypothetical protein
MNYNPTKTEIRRAVKLAQSIYEIYAARNHRNLFCATVVRTSQITQIPFSVLKTPIKIKLQIA